MSCLKCLPPLGQSWAGNVGRGRMCWACFPRGRETKKEKGRKGEKIRGDREKKMGVVKKKCGGIEKRKGEVKKEKGRKKKGGRKKVKGIKKKNKGF